MIFFPLALLWLTICCFVYFLPGLLGGSLQHIGKINFYRMVPEGSSVDLSCELNNPTVDVRLWLMLQSGATFTPRKGVVKYGQLFTLHRVSNKKQGSYVCRAKSPRFYKYIGRIIVTPRLQSNVKSLYNLLLTFCYYVSCIVHHQAIKFRQLTCKLCYYSYHYCCHFWLCYYHCYNWLDVRYWSLEEIKRNQ